jgi:hypothetical protein
VGWMQNGMPGKFPWGKASFLAETFEYLNYFHYLWEKVINNSAQIKKRLRQLQFKVNCPATIICTAHTTHNSFPSYHPSYSKWLYGSSSSLHHPNFPNA